MKSQSTSPKLLDEVRLVMRLHHYSMHTERSYLDWIRRCVHFHRMQCREDLAGGEQKIEAFLADLAVRGNVAPATQNQAMNALVFLDKRVLKVSADATHSELEPCFGFGRPPDAASRRNRGGRPLGPRCVGAHLAGAARTPGPQAWRRECAVFPSRAEAPPERRDVSPSALSLLTGEQTRKKLRKSAPGVGR